MGLAFQIKIRLANYKWKRMNRHNSTSVANLFDLNKVIVGNYTYGNLFVLAHNSFHKVKIGNFCSLAPNVAFIVESDHSMNHISTFPFKTICLGCMEGEAVSKGDIIVEDDVWIGYGAVILSGVTIGQGAVIAAGSVVTENVEPYAIVGGVPARLIRYRFNKELIQRLIKIDYSKLSGNTIKEHISDLYVNVESDTDLSWMPSK